MKLKATVLTIVSILLCGLAALVLVSRGETERDITVIGPNDATDVSPRNVPPAVPLSPVPGEVRPPNVVVPVGSVVAWLKSHTNTPALPRGWVECNGQTLDLPGSPYHGLAVPNLNGVGGAENRFLRGGAQSGETGGAESHNHGVELIDRGAKRVVNVASKAPASNLPPYYEVTWILRVL